MDLERLVPCRSCPPSGPHQAASHIPAPALQVPEPSMLLPSIPPDATLLVNLAISVVGPSLGPTDMR